jgi:hypothetical protein
MLELCFPRGGLFRCSVNAYWAGLIFGHTGPSFFRGGLLRCLPLKIVRAFTKAVVDMKNKFSCLLKSINFVAEVGGLGGKWGGQGGHNPSMTQG